MILKSWSAWLREFGRGAQACTFSSPALTPGPRPTSSALETIRVSQVLRWMIPCNARFRASINDEALRSLEFPYRINRSTKPELPTKYEPQLKRLETIMRLDYVKVSFGVYKYPGDTVPAFKVKRPIPGGRQQHWNALSGVKRHSGWPDYSGTMSQENYRRHGMLLGVKSLH